MARIASQAVYFRQRGSLDIVWDIQGLIGPSPTVSIDRSESPEGPWSRLASGIDESNHFWRDYYFGQGSPSRRLYYRLTVTDGMDTLQGDPFYLGNPPKALVSQIFRLNAKYLSRRSGYPCAFFVLRRLGDNCPDCGNQYGQAANPQCLTCYGTGRAGGYYNPVKSMVAKSNPDQSQHMATEGDIKVKRIRWFWTTNTPILNAGDVMQLDDGTMWKITGEVTKTEVQGHVMRQLFAAAELTRDDIIYNLLTDLDAEFFVEKYYHVWKNADTGDLTEPANS